MVKNRLYWILWLLGMSLLYLFGNDTATRAILIASVIIPAFLIALTVTAIKKIEFFLEVPGDCIKGGTVGGKLIISCGTILPVLRVRCQIISKNMLTGEVKAEKIETTLSAKHGKIFCFDVGSDYCGKLAIGLESCHLLDTFGLSAWELSSPPDKSVLVSPKTFDIQLTIVEEINAIIDSDTYSMVKPGFDPSETFAIREYAPGDSIKSIHWKLSQKSGKLMIREYGFPIVNQMLVLFEASFLPEYGIPEPKKMDAMAEVFISVSASLAQQGIIHTIGWRHSKSGIFVGHEINSIEELNGIKDDFLSNTIAEVECTVAGCYRRFHEQCAYSHVVIVSTYIEPDIDLIYNGNRITILRCTANNSTDGTRPAGIQQQLFSDGNYRAELSKLEL